MRVPAGAWSISRQYGVAAGGVAVGGCADDAVGAATGGGCDDERAGAAGGGSPDAGAPVCGAHAATEQHTAAPRARLIVRRL